MGESRESDAVFHIAGWILFILFLASLIFLAACILFLVPLLRPDREGRRDIREAGRGSEPKN